MAKKFQSMDGNQAAAYASYAFTEVAGIYPITPSTPMAEYTDEWASKGMKNIFGMPVKVVEMQSEAGAAGSVHGSLQVGALTTTYTASQGLLLKIPNMYKIAGQLLPGVIHVAARAIAAQALSIFGDHQDVMACRQTGFAMFATGSVQEVMDLAGVAHLAAIKGSVPFLHFFDGFRTSHEVNRVEVMDYEVFKNLIDMEAVERFRKNALSPLHPVSRGTAQNDDVYFQTRELQVSYYNAIPDIVNDYMKEISKVTGRNYAPFNYYGAEDATDVIVAMGSVTEAIEETVDLLVKQGKKVGVVKVHLFRPFSQKYFFDAMPKTVKRIAVLDRTIEPGCEGEPLYLDVKSAFYGTENQPTIIGGVYGLSSKDTTPSHINAIYKNLASEQPKNNFTIGIIDDVNYSSLEVTEEIDVATEGTTELLFFGLGSDGTVGACKNISKIVGDYTDLYAQSYAAYDSKKSGGSTRLHLRFSPNPIRSTYLVDKPHFVSCSLDAYLNKFDMLKGLRNGGTFLLNTVHTGADEIEERLPNKVKRQLAEKNAKLYVINANKLALECGFRPGLGVNTIMQSAFFKLNQNIMSYEESKEHMKQFAEKTYAKKGQALVDQNCKAIDLGGTGLIEITVKPEWANLTDEVKVVDPSRPKFISTILDSINAIEGDNLPVSAFKDWNDGKMINGAAAYEKRGTASNVPVWIEENCIQCNQCTFVCPHAVIRPFLVDEVEAKNAPAGAALKKANGKGLEGFQYTMQISTLDCTGCGVCVGTCPAKEKALKMVPIDEALKAGQAEQAKYFFENVTYKSDLVGKDNPKNVGFAQPLFEFSGACAGCGETPYVKAISQLFGERMIVANATGCSSIYSGSYPASPYTTNAKGQGPAWANSLFEDNAEFGFGMKMAYETMRDRLQTILVENKDVLGEEVNALATEWIENRKNGELTLALQPKLVAALEANNTPAAKEALTLKDYIVKHSQWIIGGDGWAYDIGYGGLDHVIANRADVNIFVIDTEVYSNTGGQSSKSARYGSIAKFTASGKENKKKDLAAIAMSYGHVYVAAISHGASQAQVIKALKEAEAYDGPSIVIGYAPCIAHGIKGGLINSQKQAKLAVECGYWPIFRYDPRLEEQGKNPLQIDCKEPNWDLYNDFLLSETRYAQLTKINPAQAQELLDANKKDAQSRWKMYQSYLSMDYSK